MTERPKNDGTERNGVERNGTERNGARGARSDRPRAVVVEPEAIGHAPEAIGHARRGWNPRTQGRGLCALLIESDSGSAA